MFKKRFKLIAAVLTVVMLVFMTGCSKTADSSDKKNAGDYKMVLILPGPINDQSWNATNYAGLVKSNETLGTKMEYVENVQAADYESTFRNYAERGYDLIMAAGTQFDEAANKVAPNYPKTTFCVVNGMVSKGANVAPIFPKEYEASYIAALMAGEVSKNGQFATIGGFPNKAMEHLLDVYETVAVDAAKERGIAGAKAVRAYANSWDDVALGKQMADTMIDNGADVMFVYANQVGLGAIQAAKEKGVKFIGFSGDQTTIDPNTVVGSVVFDFETFYVWAVQKFLDGSLDGNKVHEAGIAENIFKPVYTDNIGKDIQDKVAAGMEKVKKGEIDLTTMFKDK
ncbi:putative ABC-type transport system, periplasmic component/surface lipoprotein [Desulfosporosinus orientis DSM 765]|uniref:Putative ABC-type transport system, periplasmic component/surface lipoprotein n=1 Tax=Desulfosporosinus orientis (strain ATCC 19365 / DSM 765 / NCIMB 8382 / VKM B-1628 / Singapore I) TaxID=768706 RepID=G7WG85_DESOD|nr:BMP family protein [Desulfosporosinus orientis]AET70817.1 putative ABC-type transport system, periplasmic component/surface lipoprotein [Desulfosporosinus orientis DSM 765]